MKVRGVVQGLIELPQERRQHPPPLLPLSSLRKLCQCDALSKNDA